MKCLLRNSLLIITGVGLFTSCGDLSEKAQAKLNELEQKTIQLDSLVNEKFDKVMALDTLINFENKEFQKLETLIDKSSTKFDSIINDKSKLLENFIN